MAKPPHKQILNSVQSCVDEMLEGFVVVNPAVKLLKGHRVALRADFGEHKAAGKVAVLSGGGSGHEPFSAGYVGRGMLTGGIAGSIFTSPPPGDILAAIRAVANPAGVLLVVGNYTGDRINFGIAAEKARSEGFHVETVTVGDDCALTSLDKTAGRRGLSGLILIYKIAGAMAEEGQPLSEIVRVTSRAAQCMGTIGIALSPCHVPGSGATFQIADDDIELGLGAHGEPGVRRMKMCSADEITAAMIDHMTNPATSSNIPIQSGDHIMVLLNNLGATSSLELFVMARSVTRYLESKGAIVERVLAGHFITSLDMAGVSVTVLHLDDERKMYLDRETNAFNWQPNNVSKESSALSQQSGSIFVSFDQGTESQAEPNEDQVHSAEPLTETSSSSRLVAVLQAVCRALVSSEDTLNEMDRAGGDGDCGTTMKRGAEAFLCSSLRLPVAMGAEAMMGALSGTVQRSMGGSSGGLYSLFLTAAARPLGSNPCADQWVDALGAGIQAVCRYGGAEPGDRTMIDPLHVAWTTLRDSPRPLAQEHFQLAVKAAEDMAKDTASMQARAGRASYVNRELVRGPDPGAHAVAIWLRAAYLAFYGE